uniref:G_PROTEIN_RECEP_F1_2 domain-containing protein n=1 Tax=Caenorhabditis japonica TaxID=281687 RepID=A0A8R1DNW6_CAEJA
MEEIPFEVTASTLFDSTTSTVTSSTSEVYAEYEECYNDPMFTIFTYTMSPSKKFYYEIFTMLFCVLPVTSSLIVSIYLFSLTRSKRNATNAGDTSAFKNKVKSLAFIFATTTWTSCSLLPYRIVNLARIHLFTWSELSCEGKQRMNWIAWVLVYLLTLNPIINPLITSLIYAPYRLTIKKFLVNIPVGNRPLYSYQPDGLQSDSSFASVRRNRNRRSSCTELASLRQSTEVVRISMSEPPQTPMKSDDGFSFESHSQSSTDKKLQAGSKC